MGHPSHSRTLSVWTNGQRVGTWSFNRRGEHRLQYGSQWMSSPAERPLSLSLPFTGDAALKDEHVRNFFDNSLPDNDAIRLRIATRFKTEGAEALVLLHDMGRDCGGAVQLLGEDEEPSDVQGITFTPLSETEIEALLVQTTRSGPLGNLDD